MEQTIAEDLIRFSRGKFLITSHNIRRAYEFDTLRDHAYEVKINVMSFRHPYNQYGILLCDAFEAPTYSRRNYILCQIKYFCESVFSNLMATRLGNETGNANQVVFPDYLTSSILDTGTEAPEISELRAYRQYQRSQDEAIVRFRPFPTDMERYNMAIAEMREHVMREFWENREIPISPLTETSPEKIHKNYEYCPECKYHVNSEYLKCTVNPTGNGASCKDFEKS